MKLFPRTNKAQQECDTGHSNCNCKSSLDTFHIRQDNARKCFRWEYRPKLRRTRRHHCHRIDAWGCGGQTGEHSVDERGLRSRDAECTAQDLEDYTCVNFSSRFLSYEGKLTVEDGCHSGDVLRIRVGLGNVEGVLKRKSDGSSGNDLVANPLCRRGVDIKGEE